MSLKEKMMESMMGNMSKEEKKEMMDKMMEKFFADVSPEEKQEMMQGMMSKMMGSMNNEGGSKENSSPMMNMMSMMMGGKSPMMDMMGMMMGKNENPEKKGSKPWDMCQKMMSGITKSSELAAFATPELRGLFEEWLEQIETEFIDYINANSTINNENMQENFKLSEQSINYILTRLSQKDKIKYKISIE